MMRWSARQVLRFAARILAAPFIVTDWLTRAIVYVVGSYILATRDILPCPGCGADVALHGWYRCEICGVTFLGSAFAPCPAPGCGSVTPYVPCPRCGHGVWNPTFVGRRRW